RASAPAMFWLVFRVAVPIRSVLRTVSVQYSQESRQANTKPTRVATTADAEQDSARPRRLARHAVGDDERHQHDVDLAEIEVRPDRLEVNHRGGYESG